MNMLLRVRLLLAIVIGLAVLAACGTAVDPGEGVELSVEVVGNGTVTSNPPGIDTSNGTSAEFSANAVVTLTATPDEGHRFVSWQGCTGVANTCVVTMNVARSITATFEAVEDPGPTPPIVNVVVTGNGTVVSDPAGIDTPESATFEFTDGASVTLTATPGVGAEFIGWGGACAAAGTDPTCTLTVDGTKNVEANFATEGVNTITSALAANSDDAEEFLGASLNDGDRWQEGFTFTTSSGLELGHDPTHGPQVVGLRFTGIDLPEGAQITSARLNFTARSAAGTTGSGTPTVTIRAQESVTAPTFTRGTDNEPGNFDITNRPLLDTEVEWAITQTWVAGTTYASPDLSALLQEVVDLGGWGPTSAVVFVIEGEAGSTAFRRAFSRDTDAAQAVTLTIEYTLP
jgi:hypothetical protein